MAEAENGNQNMPFEDKVRSQYNKSIREADSDEKKVVLVQQLFSDIRQAIPTAEAAMQKAIQQNISTIPLDASQAKEIASKPILELLHLFKARQNDLLDGSTRDQMYLIEGKMNLTSIQGSFIQRLAKQQYIGADEATFLVKIINNALSDENYLILSAEGAAPTQFELDFEQIAKNSLAKSAILEAINRLASEGQLKNITGTPITEAQVLAKLGGETVQTVEQPPTTAVMERYVRQLSATRSEQERAVNNSLGPVRDEIKQILENTSLSETEKNTRLAPLRVEEDRLENELTFIAEKHNALSEYLQSGKVEAPFTSEADINTFMKGLGFSNQDIKDIKEGFTNYATAQQEERRRGGRERSSLTDGYTGYEDLGTIIARDYSKEEIAAEILVNGKLDMKALAQVQAKLETEVGVLFQNLYNSPKSEFGESFSSYSEGQMLRNIVQHLRTTVNGIAETFEDLAQQREVRNILTNVLIASLQRRPAVEQAVHQYLQIGATIDLEKLKGVLSKYDITTLQEFYDDDVTRIMSDLMPQFIQKTILEHDNEVVTDLFQLIQVEKTMNAEIMSDGKPKPYKQLVVKYRDECINYMVDVFKDMKAKGQIEQDVTIENINARFSRAYLDNFLLSLRGVKVLARAKPMRGKFGDLPFANIITGVFNPLHNWKPGERGRGGPYEGDHESFESQIGDYVYNEDALKAWVEKNGAYYDNYHPAEEMQKAKDRLLYNMRPNNEELMKMLQSGETDVFNSMLEVYGGLGFGNVIDQAGWTFDGLPKTLNKLSTDPELADKFKEFNGKKYSDMTKEEQFRFRYKTSGVVTAFWEVGGRAGGDTGKQFKRFLAREEIGKEEKSSGGILSKDDQDKIADKYMLQFGQQAYDKKFDQYAVSDERFKKIFDVKLGGKDTKVSLREYRARRQWAVKGEVYHQMLLKDPLAWMGEMVHTYPELQQGYVTYNNASGVEKHVKASEYYFDLDTYPDGSLSGKDKEARDRFRYEALIKFKGKPEDLMSNVKHLQAIMNFHTDLINQYMSDEAVIKLKADTITFDDIKAARVAANNDMYRSLSVAHRMAVERYDAEIRPEDTILAKGTKENPVQDTRIHDAMFGQKGLITHFKDMVNSRPNYFGDGEQDLGEENGFYQQMAHGDDRKNRRTQMEGDTNMKLLFEEVENKQALERKLNTNMVFAKAQETLAKIPSICKEAGTSDSFDSWYGQIIKIHEELATLADEDQTIEQRYQMDAYMAICHYFSMDSDTDKMLVGWIQNIKLGNDIAVVSIKADYKNRFMLDADARMTYLKKLRETSLIKGNYDMLAGAGMDAIQTFTGDTWLKVAGKQAIFTVIAGAGLIIATAIKDGYEEEVDGKKKN
ncbi:hypothetical protein BH09PAT2_BH09PAT2_00340 [soil metagenome]